MRTKLSVRHRTIIWFTSRVLLGGLLAFEILNAFKILHYSLDFTWFGLIAIWVFGWMSTETIIFYQKNADSFLILPLVTASIYSDALWDILHLYSRIHNYDKFLHFFNSFILAYVIYSILYDKLYRSAFGKYMISLIIISIGSLFGTLYEIEEYLEDIFINHRALRLGDGYDTAWDLLMDVLGCTALVIIILVFTTYRNKKIVGSVDVQ